MQCNPTEKARIANPVGKLLLEYKTQHHCYCKRVKDATKSFEHIIYNYLIINTPSSSISILALEFEVETLITRISNIIISFSADIDKMTVPVLVRILLASTERSQLYPLPVAEKVASKLRAKMFKQYAVCIRDFEKTKTLYEMGKKLGWARERRIMVMRNGMDWLLQKAQ